MWEVEVTDQFVQWYADPDQLTDAQREAVTAVVDLLADHGPSLKRPVVGEIKGSRHKNMKELCVSEEGELRVLFLFDPRRAAILLLGGNKTGDWNDWYKTAVPAADDLYDDYLDELKKEGLI
ncbi:MAG TPA: type II toxin-antitoxin system RelE/ParE family toxin [Acidimicrobiales bacterium]|nr:type II toxin-antitoxin system RelE/ParE family toxin [Acidimicrobiales bacterium]